MSFILFVWEGERFKCDVVFKTLIDQNLIIILSNSMIILYILLVSNLNR
jgi:hypothetical protein